jgi:hypothetical protein
MPSSLDKRRRCRLLCPFLSRETTVCLPFCRLLYWLLNILSVALSLTIKRCRFVACFIGWLIMAGARLLFRLLSRSPCQLLLLREEAALSVALSDGLLPTLSVALSLSLESCLLLCRLFLSVKRSCFVGWFAGFYPKITLLSHLVTALSIASRFL